MISNSKLLTIGIPTYNRGFLLDTCISFLISDLGILANRVTIMISDNSSSDATAQISQKYIELYSDTIDIRYFKQEINVGVSKNLVSLFYRCETPYFMFLGDDDRLNSEFFPFLISTLESPILPSAVIQAKHKGKIRYGKTGYLEFNEAFKLFGEYGNAYSGVIDAKAAVKAIDSRNLRNKIEEIVWPQTVIAYLAMHDLKHRLVYITDQEIGFQFTEKTVNIANRSYWVRSTHDLTYAASVVDKEIGGNKAKSSFVRLGNICFANGVAAIVVASFTDKNGDSSEKLRTVLRRDYGIRGLPWRILLYISDKSPFFSEMMIGSGLFFLRMFDQNFKISVKSLKLDYQKRLEEFNIDKDRIGDWF